MSSRLFGSARWLHAARLAVLILALLLVSLLAGSSTLYAQFDTDAPIEPPPHVWPPDESLTYDLAPDSPVAQALPAVNQASPDLDYGFFPGAEQYTRLVYQAQVDNNWELYSAAGTGASDVRLTWTPEAEARPRFSPDAKTVAFDADANQDERREVRLLNLASGALSTLVSSAGSDYAPAWSPDGKRIAFVSTRDGNAEIYEIELSTNKQTRLTNYGLSDFDPTYHPITGELVWVRQVDDKGGVLMGQLGAVLRTIVGRTTALSRPRYQRDGSRLGYGLDENNDGWWDVKLMPLQENVGGGGINYGRLEVWDGSATGTDVYLNAFPPKLAHFDDNVSLTFVKYVYVRNKGFQLRSQILCYSEFESFGCRSTADGYQSGNLGLSAFADWATLDVTAPRAWWVHGPRAYTPDEQPTVLKFSIEPLGIKRFSIEQETGGTRSLWNADLPWATWSWESAECQLSWQRVKVFDSFGNASPWTPRGFRMLIKHRVSGRLIDIRGVPLASATLASLQTQFAHSVVTDAEGQFSGVTCDGSLAIARNIPFVLPHDWSASLDVTLATEAGTGEPLALGSSFTGVAPASAPLYLPPPYDTLGYGSVALWPTRGVVWAERFDGMSYEWSFGEYFGPHSEMVAVDVRNAEALISLFDHSESLRLGPPTFPLSSTVVPQQDKLLWVEAKPRVKLSPETEQHALTLAFDSYVDAHGGILANDLLTISVKSTVWPTWTTIYAGSLATGGWHHLWAPMPLQVGSGLSVRVELLAKAGQPIPSVHIDNLLVASWWTPRATGMVIEPPVQPSAVEELQAGTVVTITGENFIAPVSVAFGPLKQTATIVNDHTLKLQLTGPIPPGFHMVTVTNAAGTNHWATSAAGHVRSGKETSLPVVWNWD